MLLTGIIYLENNGQDEAGPPTHVKTGQKINAAMRDPHGPISGSVADTFVKNRAQTSGKGCR